MSRSGVKRGNYEKMPFIALIGLCLLILPLQAGITPLHEFAGGAADGAGPQGSLVISGSTLYGMTEKGGHGDMGTIFKVQADGSGFILLHEFSGGAADGAEPRGSLSQSGRVLFGMTRLGGEMNRGTIFKIQNNGAGFTLLHEFTGGAADGAGPQGSLLISGSTLYGMTEKGGHRDMGTIFKVQAEGTGFTLLHEFSGGSADGRSPLGSLLISGSTLYGMTEKGGYSDDGTIFKIQTDGTDFTLLHEFAAGIAGGFAPCGDLLISGSTLYGITRRFGSIFRMQADGTGFTLLHEFVGGVFNGENSSGSLVLSGAILYGMTAWGGDSDRGTIFRMQTDGTGFSILHEFAGGAADGSYPYGSLVISGSTLLGMTSKGGSHDHGLVFSLAIPPTSVDFIGSWGGQGVCYRNSETGAFVKLATPASQIVAGDLDGDGLDDLIGIWPGQGGVWVKYSASGRWAKLSPTARDISVGDMNGDGRVDLVVTWDGKGVYYRHSISGAWVKMATPAEQVTAGDLDGDGKDDLIGIWPSRGGVLVNYSKTGIWTKLLTSATAIACGDMNGDGRDDLVASRPGQGVSYRNSITGAWLQLAKPATQITVGDLDGDGQDDLIGIWPGQDGVFIKYSQSGSWAKLSSKAIDIAVGRMRTTGATLYTEQEVESFVSAANDE